jgi:hypothetical protein
MVLYEMARACMYLSIAWDDERLFLPCRSAFEAFEAVKSVPEPLLTLVPYCRWATRREEASSRRREEAFRWYVTVFWAESESPVSLRRTALEIMRLVQSILAECVLVVV